MTSVTLFEHFIRRWLLTRLVRSSHTYRGGQVCVDELCTSELENLPVILVDSDLRIRGARPWLANLAVFESKVRCERYNNDPPSSEEMKDETYPVVVP